MFHRTGPRTEPCGTLASIGLLHRIPFLPVNCTALSEIYESIIRLKYGGNSFFLNALRVTRHGILLKAFCMFSPTTIAYSPLSLTLIVRSLSRAIASQVERCFLKPYWFSEKSDSGCSVCQRYILSAIILSNALTISFMKQIGLTLGSVPASDELALGVNTRFAHFQASWNSPNLKHKLYVYLIHSRNSSFTCFRTVRRIPSGPGALVGEEEIFLTTLWTSPILISQSSDHSKFDQSSITSGLSLLGNNESNNLSRRSPSSFSVKLKDGALNFLRTILYGSHGSRIYRVNKFLPCHWLKSIDFLT